MLNPNFENIDEGQRQAHHTHLPKRKTQYSCGFRQLLPNTQITNAIDKYQQKNLMKSAQTKSSQIMDYVDQLGIQNLSKLYRESIPDNSHLLLEKQKQQQEQSTVRLYRNLYPGRKNRETEQEEDKKEQQNKKYAESIWDLDPKYEKLPPDYIMKKQMEKFDGKCKAELTGALKKQKIQSGIKFQQIFAYFLIQQHSKILQSIKKKSDQANAKMEIFYMWKGFLSTINFKSAHKKYEKSSISQETIQNLRKCCAYLFLVIKQQKLKQKQKKPAPLSLDELKNRINFQLKFQVSELKDTFEIKKSYTNPLNIQSLAHHKSDPKKQPQQPIQQQVYIFKANPVPKSTYHDPKEKIKPDPKTTVQVPFKLTEKAEGMTPEQYYHFQKDRQFKAQQIPNTTYKPYKPELLSQEEKKARATLMLQKSKYPKTMRNLKQYAEHQKIQLQELGQKHAKPRNKSVRNEIPNFDRLHAQQIILFQTLKQNNKKDIKVEPFHLSVGKKKHQIQQNRHDGRPEIHPYSPPAPSRPSKSTKKYQAYVHFRSEQQKKNSEKMQKQEQKRQQQMKSKEPYRQILKKRMAEEFQDHPRKANQYDPSMPMKIKLDKQKIYKQEPLLMKSSLPKQEYCLSWEPIF